MDDDALLEAALLESAALHREEAMLAAAIAESQECMNLNRTAPPELLPATSPTTLSLSPPSVRRNTRNAPAAVLDSSAGRTIRPAASNPARQRRLQQREQQREQQCRLAPTAAPPESSGTPPKPPERAPRPRLTAPLHGQEHPSWRLPELLPPVARATPPPSAAPPVIVWLRAGDMRLTDNPALHAAAESGNPVIPVFIQPPRCEEGGWPLAGAAAYWLHHSLVSLQHSLSRLGSAVVVRRAADCGGSSAAALAALAAESGSRRVCYNASFEPWVVRRDEALEQELASQGVRAKRCAGNVLYHPEDARPDERTAAHGFGSVGFFLAAVATLPPPPPPLPPPRRLKPPAAWPHSLPLSELGYGRLPVRPDGTVEDWAAGIRRSWAVGEIGAQRALEAFVSGGIQRFEGRERFRADQANTAAISPHLRFGELSARAVLHSVRERASAPTFLRRLAWRDLAYWALWRFPHLPSRPFRPWFEAQAWSSDQPALEAWQAGATGFPLVDAAMAQLWATGWMPNYMRHVVAGFLVEFLNLDWRRVLPPPPLPHRLVCVEKFSLPVPRHGLRWFDYTLVDADTAINAYMWQNGGHSGMDQWNFVMHPVFAAKSCDPEGDYVRRWLPQLAALPVEYIHCPWEAPFALRAAAGVVLGGNYPKRILDDLEAARRASHAAVMAVRRGPARGQVLPSGHEWLALDNGVRATLITREDYREGTLSRDGELITGDKIRTRQSADDKWDARRRERTDFLSRALGDAAREHQAAARRGGGGGGGDGVSDARGRGKGRGRGRAGGRGGRSNTAAVIPRPAAWG